MPALLLYGDTERSPALRHELPIAMIDPLLYAEVDGRVIVLTSLLERARIEEVRPEAEILDYVAFGLIELRRRGLSFGEADREVVARVVRELGIGRAIVPTEFPVGLADRLRADGVELTVDDDAILGRRRSKQGKELEGIRLAQRAAEAGMSAAAEMLARAESGPQRRVHLDGQELHAEHVRQAIRTACADLGAPCPPDIMVASVWSGFGHESGSGPLPAGLPIQVDLWPQDEATTCWADMTRTFLVGDPRPEDTELIGQQEELVGAAHRDACQMVRAGVSGQELFDAVCERFEAAGFRTQRTGQGDDPAEGFQFSLGHGVGLELHEEPTLGLSGHDTLVAGDVIAVEPGLWDRRIGGVRFEDLVLVTDDGHELLTRFPYELRPGQ
ncbi:MAG: M24 family metallopeptidase [Solirubrobacteraceae bacterium]